jgi:hypothetical protein
LELTRKTTPERKPKINNSDQGWNPELNKKIEQPKKKKDATKKRTEETLQQWK